MSVLILICLFSVNWLHYPVSGVKRIDSARGRKVSTQSLQSTASVEESSFAALSRDSIASASAVDSAGLTPASAAGPPLARRQTTTLGGRIQGRMGWGREGGWEAWRVEEQDYARTMPWIKVSTFLSTTIGNITTEGREFEPLFDCL